MKVTLSLTDVVVIDKALCVGWRFYVFVFSFVCLSFHPMLSFHCLITHIFSIEELAVILIIFKIKWTHFLGKNLKVIELFKCEYS